MQYTDDTYGDGIGNNLIRAIALPPRNNAAQLLNTQGITGPQGLTWKIQPDTTLYPTDIVRQTPGPKIRDLILGSPSADGIESWHQSLEESRKVNFFTLVKQDLII